MIRIAILLFAAIIAPPLFAQTPTAQTSTKIYAQELVDWAVTRHPELQQVDLHAAPPTSVIIAAKEPGRVGHKSDPDDIEVFTTGTPRVEINRIGDQNVEVALPLIDVKRRPIGTLEMTFPYEPGFDREALIAKAEENRDELSRRILSEASLFEPVQIDARIPIRTFAQSLVDDVLARHPEVEVVAIHAMPPQVGAGYPIVASNIGRIGKAADDGDLEVIRTGKPSVAIDAAAARLEAKIALQDASGNTIGALAVVFPYKKGRDQGAFLKQAEKIRDELRPRIAGAGTLYGAYTALAEAPAPVQSEYDKQELGNKQTLPMTKAVVSGRTLEQASQDGYAEAVKGVAGVSPANSEGTANDSINIRGIKLNLFSNYRLNGGLPVAGVISNPTENKQRIETLKGANALMFGVASPAGIINLVTKRASDVDVNSVAAAGNAFGQYGASVDIGRRLGAEKQFGIRMNASAVHLENGVRNLGGSGNFASLGFDYKLTDRLAIQGDYEYYSKKVPEQAGVSLLPAVNGVVPITPVPDPRNLLGGKWGLYTPQTTNQLIRADYTLTEGWKILAETGRSDSDRSRFTTRISNYDIVTGDNGVVTVQATTQEFTNTFSRVETLGKFSAWSLKHDLTLGTSKSVRNSHTVSQNQTTLSQTQNIFAPIELDPPVFSSAPKALPLITSADTAVYGYDTISIGPQWKVLLGLRSSQNDEDSGTATSSTRINSPAYGALYDVMPSLTVFASYMEGLESGATAPASAVNFNEILPSAVSTQKEIGIRDSHSKGLSVSGSYFEISRANPVTDPVTKIFANSGVIEYKGVEATLRYDFAPRWTFNATGQWLRATQRSPDPRFDGLVPENTPNTLGNLSLTHRPLWLPGLSLGGGVRIISERFVNPQEQGTIPGYELYNLRAGYVTRIDGHRAAFQLNVDNVTNLRYWNSVQTGTYGTGMDRSIKFNARIDF